MRVLCVCVWGHQVYACPVCVAVRCTCVLSVCVVVGCTCDCVWQSGVHMSRVCGSQVFRCTRVLCVWQSGVPVSSVCVWQSGIHVSCVCVWASDVCECPVCDHQVYACLMCGSQVYECPVCVLCNCQVYACHVCVCVRERPPARSRSGCDQLMQATPTPTPTPTPVGPLRARGALPCPMLVTWARCACPVGSRLAPSSQSREKRSHQVLYYKQTESPQPGFLAGK